MPFASPGAQASQPEIGVRLRVRGDDSARDAFARLRDESRTTFQAVNRDAASQSGGLTAVGHVASEVVHVTGDAVRGALGEVTEVLGKIGQAATWVGAQFRELATTAGVTGVAAGVGITGLTAAMGAFVEKNEEGIQRLRSLSEETGIAVDWLSRFAAAARIEGGEDKNIFKSLSTASQSFFKSAAADAVTNPFLHIGVQTKDADGKLRPFNEVLGETITALSGIKNVSDRNRAAFEIFGDGYSDVMGVIATSTDAATGKVENFATRMAAAAKYGTALTDANVKAFADQEKDKAGIQERVRDVGNAFTFAFLPLFSGPNPFVSWVAKNADMVKGWIGTVASGISDLKDDVKSILGIDDDEEEEDDPNAWRTVRKGENDGSKRSSITYDPADIDRANAASVEYGKGSRPGVPVRTGVTYDPGHVTTGVTYDPDDLTGERRRRAASTSTGPGEADDSDDDGSDGPDGDEDPGKDLHNKWLGPVATVVARVRRALAALWQEVRTLDLKGALATGFGWLQEACRSAWGVLGQVGLALLDVGRQFGAFEGVALSQAPSVVETFRALVAGVSNMWQALRGGGDLLDHPWLRALGQAVRDANGAVRRFAASLGLDQLTIRSFATGAMAVLVDAVHAVGAAIRGDLIPRGNVFAWLQPVVDFAASLLGDLVDLLDDALGPLTWDHLVDVLRAQVERVRLLFHNLVADVRAVLGGVRDAVGRVVPYLQTLAGWLGLKGADGKGDAGQLVIAGLILWLTGLTPVILQALGVVAEFMIGLGGLANVLRLVGQIIYPVLSAAALGIAALLGIPVAAAGAIVALLLAAAAVAYYYWDSIQAGAHRANMAIEGAFRAMAAVVVEAARTIWDALTAPFRWLWDMVLAIGRLFADTWRVIAGGGQQAWDDLRADWSGLLDLFAQPIRAIEGLFQALWDKVKHGASDAWAVVRRVLHLGGGDEETEREEVASRGVIAHPDEQGPTATPEQLRDMRDREAGTGRYAPAPDDWSGVRPADIVESDGGSGGGLIETVRRLFATPTAPAATTDPQAPAQAPAQTPWYTAPDLGSATAPRPPHRPTARELWRQQWGDPDDPSNYNARQNAPAYPGETEDDRLDAAEEAAERSRRARAASYRVDPSMAPTLDDLAGDVGQSVSTARTGVDRSGGLPQTSTAAAGAPLTIVIGGQTIDGLTYSPDALAQIRAAQRANSIGGRAPDMRGSGY